MALYSLSKNDEEEKNITATKATKNWTVTAALF